MSTTMAESNTFVSTPGFGTADVSARYQGAPGASGTGGNMSMTAAVLWLIGGAAVVGVGTAYLARKGVRPEIGRFDVLDATWNAATVAVMFGTAKVLAYRFHGHRISQAVLEVL